MTARAEMANLLGGDQFLVTEMYLDAIASLATNPETAPVVFRWLLEAGVLIEWRNALRGLLVCHKQSPGGECCGYYEHARRLVPDE